MSLWVLRATWLITGIIAESRTKRTVCNCCTLISGHLSGGIYGNLSRFSDRIRSWSCPALGLGKGNYNQSHAFSSKRHSTHEFSQKTVEDFAADGIGLDIWEMHSSMGNRKMSFADLPNLWVPLALLGLIVLAAVFFSRSRWSLESRAFHIIH